MAETTQEPPATTTKTALYGGTHAWMTKLGEPPGQETAPDAPAATATPTPTQDGKTGPGSGATDASGVPNAAAPAAAVTPPAEQPKPGDKPAEKAAVVTPEKPVEPAATKPTEDDEKWPRSSEDWKKRKEAEKTRLETLRKEHQAEVAKLKAEFEAAKAAKPAEPTTPPPEFELLKAEAEKLRKENEEYSNRLQILDVVKHPKFEAYFANKTNAQVELAKKIVGPEKAPEIERLINLPDGEYRNQAVDQFLGELGPSANSRIGGVLNSLEAIEAERQGEIARAKTLAEQDRANRELTQKKAVEQTEQTWKAVISKLQDPQKGLAVYQLRDGDSEWNNLVLDQIATAKKLVFERNDPAFIAESALQAAAFPTILKYGKQLMDSHAKAIEAKETEIKTLKDQVAALSAAQPAAGKATENPTPVGERPISQVATNPMDATRIAAQRYASAASW